MTEDTQKEPVSVEEEIASLIKAGEDAEKEEANEESEQVEEEAEADDSGDEPEEGQEEDAEPGDEADSGDSTDDDEELPADDEPDTEDEPLAASDKLEAPEHWAAEDKESFDAVPREGQEFLLKRHKEMEAHFTRKNQERADIDRQYGAVRDALAPIEQDFTQSGLDHAGAVRQLAHWHQALKTGGKPAVLELARTYGIDLSEPDYEEADPAIRQTQSELAQIKQELARNKAEAQQQEHNQLLGQIKAFETATDESGNRLHPHFEALKDDITGLFQGGIAKDLEDGYKKALALRPDLTPRKEVKEAVKEVSQAEKVKKAKLAATGVKSSGAVGKRQRKEMSLEEEIASHFS